jgi:hypothetical protein
MWTMSDDVQDYWNAVAAVLDMEVTDYSGIDRGTLQDDGNALVLNKEIADRILILHGKGERYDIMVNEQAELVEAKAVKAQARLDAKLEAAAVEVITPTKE